MGSSFAINTLLLQQIVISPHIEDTKSLDNYFLPMKSYQIKSYIFDIT